MSTTPMVVYLHVHKTGGSALLVQAREVLGSGVVDATHLADAIRDNDDLFARERLAQATVVIGHHLELDHLRRRLDPGRPISLATCLREPHDRLVSLFAQQAAINPARWLADLDRTVRRPDPVCHFVLRRFSSLDPRKGTPAERAAHVLGHFAYVADHASPHSLDQLTAGLLGSDVTLTARVNAADPELKHAAAAAVAERRALIDTNHAGDIALYEQFSGGSPCWGSPVRTPAPGPAPGLVIGLSIGLIGPWARRRALLPFLAARSLVQAAGPHSRFGVGAIAGVPRRLGWARRNLL